MRSIACRVSCIVRRLSSGIRHVSCQRYCPVALHPYAGWVDFLNNLKLEVCYNPNTMDELLNREQILEILREELPYLRERYGVESVAIYGSYSKGSYTDKSDIDILVKLTRPLGFDFVGLALYLEDVLGRKVDLITHDTLERNLDNPRYSHIANDIQGTLAYA